MDQSARIRAQEIEIEKLRDRITLLEELLTDGIKYFPAEWRLSQQEQQILALLTARQCVTKDAFMSMLYSDRVDCDVDQKIVDVLICKIRKKLKPQGIQINTLRGKGYFMTIEDRTKVKQAVEALGTE